MKKITAIVMLMMLILAGCSGKDKTASEKKEQTKTETVTEKKDVGNDIYGTWRTCAISVNGVRFTMDQIEALGNKDAIDMIFVINEDGSIYGYSFYEGNELDETYTTGSEGKSIIIDGTELPFEDGELLFVVGDTTAHLEKISDRQDKEIIKELTGKESIPTEEPKQEESKPEKEPEPETDNNTVSEDTIRPEVKEAIDAYEAFIDEYCEFMVRYSKADGTDLGLLADYAKFMSKLGEYESKMDQMEDDLTDAEYWYYYEVLTRCNEKIIKAAQ